MPTLFPPSPLIILIFSFSTNFYRNTAVSGIISESALETSAGIQSTLGKNITSLQYLKPGGSFSIKEWFSNSNETGWLFITANPSQRATLCPLISAWISIAIKALMYRNPNHAAFLKISTIFENVPFLTPVNQRNFSSFNSLI